MMWEYRFDFIRVGIHTTAQEQEQKRDKARMKCRGGEGWEAISMVPASYQEGVVVVLFKRLTQGYLDSQQKEAGLTNE